MPRPAKIMVVAFLLFSFALVPAAGAAEAAILEKKCTSCHGVDIIQEHKRTVSEWQEIVARMAGHAEGELSKIDQLIVLKYLKQHLAVEEVE